MLLRNMYVMLYYVMLRYALLGIATANDLLRSTSYRKPYTHIQTIVFSTERKIGLKPLAQGCTFGPGYNPRRPSAELNELHLTNALKIIGARIVVAVTRLIAGATFIRVGTSRQAGKELNWVHTASVRSQVGGCVILSSIKDPEIVEKTLYSVDLFAKPNQGLKVT